MLWRYTENQRNFPGWHFTASIEGCSSLVALLDAFAADGIESSRTLSVTAPTSTVLAVPNNRSGAPFVPSKFRLSFSDFPSQLLFQESDSTVALSVGSRWLSQLRQAVADIPFGKGDYSIGASGSEKLWFWWQPTAA